MDASRLEKRTHGTEEFPFQIYPMTGSQDGDVIPYHWHPELEIIRILAACGRPVFRRNGRAARNPQRDGRAIPFFCVPRRLFAVPPC